MLKVLPMCVPAAHPGPLPQPSRGRYGSAGREREDHRQSVGESYGLAMFEGRAVLLPLLGERAGVRGNGLRMVQLASGAERAAALQDAARTASAVRISDRSW